MSTMRTRRARNMSAQRPDRRPHTSGGQGGGYRDAKYDEPERPRSAHDAQDHRHSIHHNRGLAPRRGEPRDEPRRREDRAPAVVAAVPEAEDRPPRATRGLLASRHPTTPPRDEQPVYWDEADRTATTPEDRRGGRSPPLPAQGAAASIKHKQAVLAALRMAGNRWDGGQAPPATPFQQNMLRDFLRDKAREAEAQLQQRFHTPLWRDGLTCLLDSGRLHELLIMRASVNAFCNCGCPHCSSHVAYYARKCTCNVQRCPGRIQALLHRPLVAPLDPVQAMYLGSDGAGHISVDQLWAYLATYEPVAASAPYFLRAVVQWMENNPKAPLPSSHFDLVTAFTPATGGVPPGFSMAWSVVKAILWLPTLGSVCELVDLVQLRSKWGPSECLHPEPVSQRGIVGAVNEDPMTLAANQYIWVQRPAGLDDGGSRGWHDSKLLYHLNVAQHLDCHGPGRAAVLQLSPSPPPHTRTPSNGELVRRDLSSQCSGALTRLFLVVCFWLAVGMAVLQFESADSNADVTGAVGATIMWALVSFTGVFVFRIATTTMHVSQSLAGYTALRLAVWRAWRSEHGAWVLALYRLIAQRAIPGSDGFRVASLPDPTFTALTLCEPPPTPLRIGGIGASVISTRAPRVEVVNGRPIVAARPTELRTFVDVTTAATRLEHQQGASGVGFGLSQAPRAAFTPGVMSDRDMSGPATGRDRGSPGLCGTPSRYSSAVRLPIVLVISFLHGVIPMWYAAERDDNSLDNSCFLSSGEYLFGGCRGDLAVASVFSMFFAAYFLNKLLTAILDLHHAENLMRLMSAMTKQLLPATQRDPTSSSQWFVPAPGFSLVSRADVDRWLATRDLIQRRTLWPSLEPNRSWAHMQTWLTMALLASVMTGCYVVSRVAWRTWAWGPVHAALIFDFVVLASVCTYGMVRAAAVNTERKKHADMLAHRHMQLTLMIRQHEAAVNGLQLSTADLDAGVANLEATGGFADTNDENSTNEVDLNVDDDAASDGTDDVANIGASGHGVSHARVVELKKTAELLSTVVDALPTADKAFVMRLVWLPVSRIHAGVFAIGFAIVWVALVLAEMPALGG